MLLFSPCEVCKPYCIESLGNVLLVSFIPSDSCNLSPPLQQGSPSSEGRDTVESSNLDFPFQRMCWLVVASLTGLLGWCVHGEYYLVLEASRRGGEGVGLWDSPVARWWGGEAAAGVLLQP